MNSRTEKISLSNEKFSSILLTLLEENMEVAIDITGESMFPLWRHKRDSVVLIACDKTALRKGQIPLYRRGTGQYVLHRIVKVNSDSYNLCGDAQTQIEYNFPKENIIAVVKSFTRKGKEYSCDNLCVKAYSTVWIWLFPFRGILLKVCRKLSGIFK